VGAGKAEQSQHCIYICCFVNEPESFIVFSTTRCPCCVVSDLGIKTGKQKHEMGKFHSTIMIMMSVGELCAERDNKQMQCCVEASYP